MSRREPRLLLLRIFCPTSAAYYMLSQRFSEMNERKIIFEKQKPIDLTLAAQKSVKFPGETDNRFFWNRMLHIPFVRFDIQPENW